MTVSTDLDRIDLSDLDLFADGPPWELFARMRAEAPVHRNANPELRFWSVMCHDDIEAVSKDFETFSSELGGINMRDDDVFPIELARLAMINMDPPRHTRLRNIVQKVFTPRVIAERENQVRRLTTELLDAVMERGECDLVSDIAVPVPIAVIAEMLGVPESDQPKLFDWTNRIAGFDDPSQRKDVDDGMQAMQEIAAYLVGLITARRETPTQDLISRLAHADVDGEQLDDATMVLFFILLMGAGNETTRNTFSGGMLALIEHPDERAKLLDDPALIPGAIEEILRWTTAVQHFRRTATRDTELRGVPIKKGDKVVMWYGSGNRDENVFASPDRFDVTRADVGAHQTFGAGGRHFCLGNQLGRLELRILFGETLRRMPDMKLAGDIRRLRANLFNGFLEVPVSFTPSRDR